jgi:hypothetical protein
MRGSGVSGYLTKDKKMHISGESLVIILVVGLVAGWLAGQSCKAAGLGASTIASLALAAPSSAIAPVPSAVTRHSPSPDFPLCFISGQATADGMGPTNIPFSGRCRNTRIYEKGVKVSDAEMAMLNIAGDDCHPECSCTIKLRLTPKS